MSVRCSDSSAGAERAACLKGEHITATCVRAAAAEKRAEATSDSRPNASKASMRRTCTPTPLVTHVEYSCGLALHWSLTENTFVDCPSIGHAWRIFLWTGSPLATLGEHSCGLALHWPHSENILVDWLSIGHTRRIFL
jgi:hypothetical protein